MFIFPLKWLTWFRFTSILICSGLGWRNRCLATDRLRSIESNSRPGHHWAKANAIPAPCGPQSYYTYSHHPASILIVWRQYPCGLHFTILLSLTGWLASDFSLTILVLANTSSQQPLLPTVHLTYSKPDGQARGSVTTTGFKDLFRK